MWRNPNYPAPTPPVPPQENGERLGTFPRGDGSEMRVNLATFEGKPFVSLRLWERDQTGGWWPVKGKGCSVRISEAGELASVLASLAGRTTPPPAGRDDARPADREADPAPRRDGGPQRGPDRGRPQRQDYRELNLPPLAGGSAAFDECAESP